MFRDVLGWAETEIVREEPADTGYADYVIGVDFNYYHIEAKRVRPRLKLSVSAGTRIVNVNGPHLLCNPDTKKHVLQAAKYAFSLGTEYAVLTNGEQYVIFRTHIRGRRWEEGKAFVFSSLDDIESHFADFWTLLAREPVRAGSLIQKFEAAEAMTVTLSRALDHVNNSDMEMIRNPFWDTISEIVSPLLVDDPLNKGVQDDIIRHCYVATPMADDTDSSIDRLLQQSLPPRLEIARFKNIEIGMRDRSAFDRTVEEDIKTRNLGTYILTGGVGSGKTTFLRRFVTEVAPKFVQEFCVWLHIDYLAMGSVPQDQLDSRIREYTYSQIRNILRASYFSLYPGDGGRVRELFATELGELAKTKLYGVSEQSAKWKDETNSLIATLFDNDEVFVSRFLPTLGSRGYRVVIVLDNTDQQGERFQEIMFLFGQRLSSVAKAMTIIALREEKFFAAYRRGVFDAYGQRRFHIGSPDIKKVIQARLDYALRVYSEKHSRGKKDSSKPDVAQVLQVLISSTTHRRGDIARYLACLSNGDMRVALSWFRDFMSSGNTDVEKIVNIVKKTGEYTVGLHEFVKSAVLAARRYYSASKSHVVNLFARSSTTVASNMTAVRILARLSRALGAPSAHGEGYVPTTQLLKEYRMSFGTADDFVSRAGELLARGLLESEPPRAPEVERTEALRISAAGEYYLRFLARSFAYIDLVYIDTPLADGGLVRKLAELAPSAGLAQRFERVRLFLDCLQLVESRELEVVVMREGVYHDPIIPVIRQAIEAEIEKIAARNKILDAGGRWKDNE